MNYKTPVLFALLTPGLAMLAACDRAPDADDTAKAPVAAMPAPATTPPPAPAPAESLPAESMPAAGVEMTFADMDKNHDGKLTKDELAATDMLSQHFPVADADHNGSLSEAEVTKHRADMAASPAK